MKKDKENESIREKRERNDALNKSESEKRLPGEYPPNEDIMNRLNQVERIGLDPDNIPNSKTPGAVADKMELPFPEDRDTHAAASRGPSDLTKEDLEALGPRDLSLDGGDDEQLKHRVWPVDFSARDIDVPGSELDDRSESVGSEDEENNSYSLGGDDKENLEDDPTRTLG
jgi:hypothetical protein